VAIITFPGEECWASPRWAFARLARSTSMFLNDPRDLEALEGAVTRDRLSFLLLEPAQATRLALALRQGASWLREELIAENSGDESDEELALSLTPLSTQLGLMLANQRRAARAQAEPAPAQPLKGAQRA
jgi:hypothetical protein